MNVSQELNSPQPSSQEDEEFQINVRDEFNNIEIRHNFVRPEGDHPCPYEFHNHIMNMLRGLSDRVTPLVNTNDIVQIEVNGPGVSRSVTFSVDEGGSNVMHQFETFLDDLMQSNAEIASTERLEFVIQTVRDLSGGARRKAEMSLDCELIHKKRRHLYIVNNDRDDKLCFAISLACVADPSLGSDAAIQLGRELQQRAGLSEHTPVRSGDIHKFEKLLNRKIVVFIRSEGERALGKIQTDFEDRSRTVFLLHFRDHYYGIKNLKGFIGARDICHYCFDPIGHKYNHVCKGSCAVCNDAACAQGVTNPILCHDCNRYCKNQTCYDRHKVPELKPRARVMVSHCDQVKKCPNCGLNYNQSLTTGKKHVCQGKKCRICGGKLDKDQPASDHKCYIQTCSVDSEISDKVIFYDIETFPGAQGEHVPFLICSKSTSGEEWSAYGSDCIREFIREIRRPGRRNYTCVAHNARAFDSYLVLNAMTEMGLNPDIIMQGCKILSITDPDYGLRFIDSLSFLAMKLSKMPEALGFPDHSKGYFPHRFSSSDNLSYVGSYPLPSFYGVERMNRAEQEEFYTWYAEVSKGVFDFKKEALFYCKNDVEILLQGCTRFRQEFFNDSQIDPFNRITIASACMKVFQSNHLKADTLAVPSPTDYSEQFKKFSTASVEWLEYVSHTRRVGIQHALRGGEKKIGSYFLDGYLEVGERKIGFEFHGCEHHGCSTCRYPTAESPLTGVPYGQLYAATMEREHVLRTVYGIELEVMWEHVWEEMKKSNADVKQFMMTYQAPAPLTPREALFGGRTCAVRLRYSAAPGEQVLYQDVCSLYPFVQKTKSFPVGHPIIIRENFDDPRNYYGFIKAVISPPRGLYFPILPFRTDHGKLVFTLCRTCALENNQTHSCTHTDTERALTGVWVSEEVKEALSHGYRIDQIVEVWHFEQHSDQIFAKYVNSFLKTKQEASGYPEGVESEEDRQKYIQDFMANQGVELDPEKIKVNPAKRQVAKLCLNSLWGKFAQKNDQTQTSIIKHPDKFFEFLFSGKFVVTYFSFLNPKMVMIQWKYNKNCVTPPNKTTNVFVAAFTTAYARLELFRYLHQLQERVLYLDTDSVIYVVREGESSLPTGSYLGDLTNELPPGDTIQEFVAAGPKSYSYQTKHRGKVVMRAKGISRTIECCERVNFDTMTGLVDGYLGGERGEVLKAPQHSIKRDKNGFHLRNHSFTKTFRVVYDKRRLFPDGTTLPFGF